MTRLILFVFILCIISVSEGFGQEPPKIIAEAAVLGLSRYLSTISNEELIKCGFPEKFKVNNLSVGRPIRVAIFSNSKKDVAAFSVDTVNTNMWYVPVQFEGTIVSIITVDFHEGEFKAVGLGKALFSREIDELFKTFVIPAENEYVLIKNQKRKYDLLLIKTGRSERIFPFKSARLYLKSSDSTGIDKRLYEASSFMVFISQSDRQED